MVNKKIFLLLLLCTVCEGSIAYKDVNGVTELFIQAPIEDIDPIPVNPPHAMYIGIPSPFAVGDYNAIDVTYLIYDDEAKRTASGLTYYASDSNGYYTHYVDANDVNATSSGVPSGYGTKAHPRTTIPSTLPAGSIVEVHTAASWASSYTNFQGTSSLPVFIRGVSDPVFKVNSTSFYGSYGIIEGLYCYKKKFNISTYNTSIPQYICVRNCEIKGDGTFNNTGTGIIINGSNTYGLYTHNIVIYNCHIHYVGQWDASSENDCHAIKSDHHTAYIWILDNELDHVGGDSVQVGFNGNETNWSTNGAHHIYIANNIMHDNYEDGIDTKTSYDVIYSQNVVYNISRGGGMFLQSNYDAQSGWFLFNRIYNCKTGINAIGVQYAYAIGNIVYDITREDNYGAIGVAGPECGAFCNIVHNCPRPIKIFVEDDKICTVSNNVVSEMTSIASYSENYLENWSKRNDGIDVNDNIFYSPIGDPNIYWNGSTYGSIATWQAATSKGDRCVDSDPAFTDPDNGDFSFDSESPIMDMVLSPDISEVADRFYDAYGLNIENYITDFITDGISYVPGEN